MYYYEVFVSEAGYQKDEPLTYASESAIDKGSIVSIPYGRKSVSGFVVREVRAPSFKTKLISEIVTTQPLPSRIIALHTWMRTYYPTGSGAITQAFLPSGLQVKNRASKQVLAKPPAKLPALTNDQQVTIEAIEASEKKTFLLHGETGSGKTRLYFERTKAALNRGTSALILVPEISLIPQISGIFSEQLGERVIVLHSGLTKATRNKNWLKIVSSTEPVVVIGTRSALFAPIQHIGFIAVDEMHEPAYKQESAPRYYALRVAGKLANLHKSEIIYGSATPPVIEYFIADQTATPILRMASTARPSEKSKIHIVDLKDTKAFGRHRFISDVLIASIANRIASGEQSLLFLNRRGSFRTILCQDCGWQAACPKCDLPLTYHADQHRLRCHTCGFHSSPPYACPSCGSDDISYRSQGTKALVDSLQTLFPEALIRRFDTDNLADEQLHKHFEDIRAGKVDILVGTQMLGKGLDLPKLSLVGIVNADTSLTTPDFSANERSYQLLHQAIGRVGRGHLRGEVIVQTFQPESPTLQAAVKQDWNALYSQEIKERESFGFPPFYFLLKITVSRKTGAAAESFIYKIHADLRHQALKIKIDEPTPSFHERSHGKYNWQLIVRARSRAELVSAVKSLPPGDYTWDLDPINLL